MKPLIICLVGASGSGKTTASMIWQKQFGWKAISSYTTRPMRKGEKDGIDHWFVGNDRVPPKSMMAAYTQFGGYEYWTEWNQFLSLFPCIYVIDEKGLTNMMSHETTPFSFQLVCIKINRTKTSNIDKNRIKRDKDRIVFQDDFYDYIIDNNGTMEELRAHLYLTGQCIKQKYLL